MDYSSIVTKVLKKEDVTADIKDFTPEQTTEFYSKVKEAAKAEADKELEKIEGLRKEAGRVAAKATPADNNDFADFRAEQVTIAKSQFIAENPEFAGLSEQEKAEVEDNFKKLDSGKKTPDLIKKDYRKALAIVMGDTLLGSHRKVAELEKGAGRFNSRSVAPGQTVGSPDDEKFSPEARKLFQEWQRTGYTGPNYTLDRAQKMTQRENPMERIL